MPNIRQVLKSVSLIYQYIETKQCHDWFKSWFESILTYTVGNIEGQSPFIKQIH